MLKQISTLLLIAAAAVCAAEAPEGVPKEAKETAPGVYRFVDKDGKEWVYRKTPFGVSKKSAEEAAKESPAAGDRSRQTPFGQTRTRSPYAEPIERTAAANPTPPQKPVQTKAFEDGDSIRFERPSPFGVHKWTRKKDELTAEETRIWEAQRNAAAPENKEK